ncbi:MAG: YiiX family permuted papain-like enzyme [Bacteroidetes bacterium]|nr:YiiX family permuted papain-like enzyme [Bacteroidota bacterium]
MNKLLFIIGLSISSFLIGQPQVKDGDLIFIVNPSGQGKAIQLATKSKYTHIGIVFYENGKPMVYHAVEPVSVNTLDEFINMSSEGKYEIKRLKDDKALTKDVISSMLKDAKSLLGVHYDIYFAWDDKQLYCSEFVWKLYNRHLKTEIGQPRPLKDFDLTNPVVQEIMKSRYGSKIPYEEKMISPGDMFNSELLR